MVRSRKLKRAGAFRWTERPCLSIGPERDVLPGKDYDGSASDILIQTILEHKKLLVGLFLLAGDPVGCWGGDLRGEAGGYSPAHGFPARQISPYAPRINA